MLISEKLFDKVFEGKTQKEAYLSCSKWVASNIIAKNNCRYITYKAEKEGAFAGKVKLTVYITVEEEEIFEHNCEICREASSLFYLSGGRHQCDACRIPSFRKRESDRLESIREGLKGVIHK